LFLVLEANDAENLLERFEDASHLLQNEQGGSKVQGALSEAPGRSKGPLTFSKSSQDPHRKSQLIAAVQNHFSISSSSDISSNVMDSNTEGKKPPRIGKLITIFIYKLFTVTMYPRISIH
jgi:hypothetical protein